MKVLIGTPIHQVKEYAMERWLQNVAKLQLEYPADLLMVDNSPNLSYMEKVKSYCAKYGIKNYKMEHLEILHGEYVSTEPDEQAHERIAHSREIIRKEILSKNYDAWFSWECDQIIPVNALDELVRLVRIEDIMIVYHNSWARDILDLPNCDGGVALIKREPLEKYGFILEFGTDPEMPDSWAPGEVWFKKRVLRGGGNYIEVYGVISPIYHLVE